MKEIYNRKSMFFFLLFCFFFLGLLERGGGQLAIIKLKEGKIPIPQYLHLRLSIHIRGMSGQVLGAMVPKGRDRIWIFIYVVCKPHSPHSWRDSLE